MRGDIFIIVGIILFLIGNVSAVDCKSLSVSLLNQDPYPAVPGEYVKLVFQIDGASDTDCGTIKIKVNEGYPFSLDQGVENEKSFQAGTYITNYKNTILVPYQVRIDSNALDGENPLEISYSKGSLSETQFKKTFNITVDDTRTDFEIYVKDYSPSTKRITFDILNVGESDVEAIALEIPEQEGIKIIGNNRAIVGDLDTNEETTTSFDIYLDKENINLNLWYTDSIGTRRELNKEVTVNLENFVRKDKQNDGGFAFATFIYGIIFTIIIYFSWKWYSKRKNKKKNLHSHMR